MTFSAIFIHLMQFYKGFYKGKKIPPQIKFLCFILDGDFFTYTRREPVGVVAQIIPVR